MRYFCSISIFPVLLLWLIQIVSCQEKPLGKCSPKYYRSKHSLCRFCDKNVCETLFEKNDNSFEDCREYCSGTSLWWWPIFPISDWIAGKQQQFINLAIIDYAIVNVFGDYKIQFIPRYLKIVFCTNCYNWKRNEITCNRGNLVTVKIEMANERIKTFIPFNVSCKTGNGPKNIYEIDGFTYSSGINNLFLSWTRPSNKIVYYEIYFFNGTNQIQKHVQDAQFNSLNISNLKEKTWYQICIATTDGMWRTGRFVCKQLLTDFSVTGPVTNTSAKSESDKLLISWSNPKYKDDIPKGYVVHLKGPKDFCHIVTIKMMEMEIPEDEKCLNNITIFWSSLKTLEIKELEPYSEYMIVIIPFNRHKTSEKTVLSIKTKEGESDAVKYLTLQKGYFDHRELQVDFDEPLMPHGKILKYRIKITSTNMDICKKRKAFNYETYSNFTGQWFEHNFFKQCGLYLIEVTPVNRWDKNWGFGKSASISYEHFFERTGKMTLYAEFLSSNLARVHVEISRNADQCPMYGMIITIINENNKTDCMTKSYSNNNCDELKNNVQRSHHCSNIEYLKFNDQLVRMSIFFTGVFQKKSKYKIGSSRIFHRIENTTFSNVSIGGKASECFTDCFNPGQRYSGIRSMTKNGKICKEWKNTKYKSERSNICSMIDSSEPWCYYNRTSWATCDVPKCSKMDYGCLYHQPLPEDTSSVTVAWSPPYQARPVIGYLTLLHNTDHFCERCDLQLTDNSITEPEIDNSIKSFYRSCKSGQPIQPISYGAHFSYLHHNRTFFVYIIPIISASKSGEIKNVTVHTSLAKPAVPNNISIKAESFSEIVLSWKKPEETKEHGAALSYIVKISENREYSERRPDREEIKIKHLEMCRVYCFSVAGVNKAGSSKFTQSICFQPLAPKPDIVRLGYLKSGYLTNQSVRWSYLGSDQCWKMYRIEYWQKYKKGKDYILSYEPSVKLKDLNRNAIYVVRVRAEGMMKTTNNENVGDFSTEEQFYTGHDRLSLSYYNDTITDSITSLNITWIINEQMQGAIFEFIILLKNSYKMCQNVIHLTCDTCDEPKNQMYLTEEEKDRRLNLLKCQSVNIKTFQPDNIVFHNSMTFKNAISNFSLEMHWVNLMGLHLWNYNSSNVDHRLME